MKKTPKIFRCDKCDLTTSNKYDFTRHLGTAKHKMDNEKKRQKRNT